MTSMNANRVADMTVDELRALIRETVRDVIEEMAEDDPDAGLDFKPEVAEYLRKALRGEIEMVPWDEATRELGPDDGIG